jgi:hypothetical protein
MRVKRASGYAGVPQGWALAPTLDTLRQQVYACHVGVRERDGTDLELLRTV